MAARRSVSRSPSRRFQPPPDRPAALVGRCGSKVRCPLPVHCRRNSVFTREIAMKLTHALAGGFVHCNRRASAGPNYCGACADARGFHEDDAYFRPKGRTPRAQSKDEAECYTWSKQQSGYDPSTPPPTAVAQKLEAATGSTHRRARTRRSARRRRGRGGRRNRGQRCGRGCEYRRRGRSGSRGSRNRQAKREQEAQVNAANQQAQAAGRSARMPRTREALANFKKGMARLPGRQGLRGQVARRGRRWLGALALLRALEREFVRDVVLVDVAHVLHGLAADVLGDQRPRRC